MAASALVFFVACLCCSLVVLAGAQRSGDPQSATGEVIVPTTTDNVATPPNEDENKSITEGDYSVHIEELRTRLPSDDFHIVLQPPFVVIGDDPPTKVKQVAQSTVAWAVRMIKQDYFEQDPTRIIDIWLFKDAESYQSHCESLFGSKPHTPFGYYSTRNRALVMDISTGTGTLVHEIVHPFIEANFPACPAWFNEGLASLYEQCGEEGGHIKGRTNWRLRGLQLAIQDDRLPSFETLCSTTTREFYDGLNTNYAQARYLCYYLQEHDMLVRYYHEFVKSADADPTGFETLQTILGRTDMDQFQQDWQEYVMKLRFP